MQVLSTAAEVSAVRTVTLCSDTQSSQIIIGKHKPTLAIYHSSTSAVTVMLSDCKQMISWALMANYSTLEHSKTLGKTRVSIFSTLASTLGYFRLKQPRPLPMFGRGLLRLLPVSRHICVDECIGDLSLVDLRHDQLRQLIVFK